MFKRHNRNVCYGGSLKGAQSRGDVLALMETAIQTLSAQKRKPYLEGHGARQLVVVTTSLFHNVTHLLGAHAGEAPGPGAHLQPAQL
jgi:hypothetical protein